MPCTTRQAASHYPSAGNGVLLPIFCALQVFSDSFKLYFSASADGRSENSLTLPKHQFSGEYPKIVKKQDKNVVIRRENKAKRRKIKIAPDGRNDGAKRVCIMKNLFRQSHPHWVRHNHYELTTAKAGKRYTTPGKNVWPDVHNPLQESQALRWM